MTEIPTWQECLAAGMTAAEAARARGHTVNATVKWAKRHGVALALAAIGRAALVKPAGGAK